MFPDRESYEKAKVDFAMVDDWCLANEDEVNRALNLDMVGRVSSLAISKALRGNLPLALIAGDNFIEVANFSIAFGYYLAKNHDQGTKVPDVFDDEFPRFDGDEGDKH